MDTSTRTGVALYKEVSCSLSIDIKIWDLLNGPSIS